ncbi:hypothetical protein V5T82_09975 [Magnetovibrio sp. PR-2]|uniref:hypothetical protein n=1 Tax=Magnetovibrio sp. PR-2 TaxID=3120356 RepID=UPI002FCDF698
MATVTDQVDLILSEVQLLNAKRYGLSQEDFDNFANLMRGHRDGEDAPATDDMVQSDEAIVDTLKGRMQDWVMARMKSRTMNDMQKDVLGYDPDQLKYMSAEDLMFDMVGRRDDEKRHDSSGISSLLNTHFDLNLLQMLQG